jgi:Transposase DDE domain
VEEGEEEVCQAPHLVADKKTGKKIVGFRVAGEKTVDNKKFVPLVKEVSKKRKVAKVYADAAYDARKNFDVLHGAGIVEPAIKLRKNASTKSHGCPAKREEALLVKKLGYEGWNELKDYGKRWLVEIVLSSFKRVLGRRSVHASSSPRRPRPPSRSRSTTSSYPYEHRLEARRREYST